MNKTSLLILISVFAIINCTAQPNAGFENWHNEFSYQVPDSWASLNFLSVISSANALSAFKATGLDKHSGNYALKLKTVFVPNNPAPGVIDDTVGLVFTGKVNISPPSYVYGFPFTDRPEKLEFWAKYSPVGYDTGGVRIIMLKRNGTHRDTIAFGELKIAATPSYALFQYNIPYLSSELPDTAIVIFGASKNRASARVGSVLFIDDITFTGWVGINEHDVYADKVKIFPNPATNFLNVFAQIDEAFSVKVTDAFGRTAGVYNIQNHSANINTGLYADGIYFYEICDSNYKCLTKGKFNVTK